jgi:hypothetical protein
LTKGRQQINYRKKKVKNPEIVVARSTSNRINANLWLVVIPEFMHFFPVFFCGFIDSNSIFAYLQ